MVRAPFALQKIGTDISTGQAAGARWYIVAFQLRRYRSLTRAMVSVWDYAYGRGQYVGTELQYAGKSTWRQI